MNILFATIDCIAIIGLSAFHASAADPATVEKGTVKIEWSDKIAGDFSFAEKWSYPDDIYRNEYGQLSCDGSCPPEIDRMQNSAGRIYSDSLKAFYRFVDTTHLAHTIQCEAWCYEWAGTNFLTARQKGGDTVECFTECNASTHSYLHFFMANGVCSPTIELNSIVSARTVTYPCEGGFFRVDPGLFKKGILKTEFDLNFEHKENPRRKMFWKGRIYSKVRR